MKLQYTLVPALAGRAFAGPVQSRAVSAAPVIAQMFQWSWDSVAQECTTFLGPAGYSYVQVSPAQEHPQGDEWSAEYQVVSYNITSKHGNRAQYANMISTCHKAGVKVIADTLFNHMSGPYSGTAVGGSKFAAYSYPAVPFSNSNFHHCNNGHNDQIVNYSNATEVRFCELDTLSDLATESDYVRGKLAAYGNDLISLGIDGLRLDAAKHMPPADISNILSRLKKSLYITQEVASIQSDAVKPTDYAGIGSVQGFDYIGWFKDAFTDDSKGIWILQNLDKQGWVSSAKANVFVTNHDTERNGAAVTYRSPSNIYRNALVLSLAHSYGTPTVLSSYTFSQNTDGAPNGGKGDCTNNSGWLCQHRQMAGMVGFRNRVGTAALTKWVAPSSQRIAFARGALGFVIINNSDTQWNSTFATGMPKGTYCDISQVSSTSGVDSACTGVMQLVVDGSGNLKVTVPPRFSFAFHTGVKCTSSRCPTS
ncbi:glycoside hydrolase family 13 protein [Schizophyllum amplum]|uniref:Alpha-amylase n=1 Tax=Schizophyllum amplum TaxID=97359 RepID=A0A550CDJ4_9AGAR|nr:glycoside hydrolase family 13 protein [Auriculariopsis ampla]